MLYIQYVNRVSFFFLFKSHTQMSLVPGEILCVSTITVKSQRFPLISFLSFLSLITTITITITCMWILVYHRRMQNLVQLKKSLGKKLFKKSMTSDFLLCRVSLKVLLVYHPRTSLGPFKMAPKRPWSSSLPSRTQGTCMPPLPRIAYITM